MKRKNLWLYRSLRARTYQPTAGPIAICPHPEVKDHSNSLGVTCAHHSSLITIFDYLDWDSRYRSEATQIPEGTELTPIPPAWY